MQRILIVGRTVSIDFPVTEDALQQTNIRDLVLVILKIDKTHRNIEYSTYLDGSKHVYFRMTECFNVNELLVSFTGKPSHFQVTRKMLKSIEGI